MVDSSWATLSNSLTMYITHLGHVLHYSLDDREDIKRSMLEMCRKANMVLSTFSICDPHVKIVLTACHCTVAFSGMSCAISSNPWRLHLIIFSGVYGSSHGTLTPAFCMKLHNWTAFTTDSSSCLTASHKKCTSQSPVCFTTPIYQCVHPVGNNHYTSHKY